MSASAFAVVAANAAALALLAAIAWPRRLVTHRYELFVAAPPQTVWDTYFIHVKKADYRPGTRVLDAAILSEKPLIVRLKLQSDLAAKPMQMVLRYDLYEPYSRYRLKNARSGIAEEGAFAAEAGGTRLRLTISGPQRGLLQPFLARRRVERNQQALKAVCEGRPAPSPLGPLPRPAPWEGWAVLVAVPLLFVPLPWGSHLVVVFAAAGLGLRYLWRLAAFVRRL